MEFTLDDFLNLFCIDKMAEMFSILSNIILHSADTFI